MQKAGTHLQQIAMNCERLRRLKQRPRRQLELGERPSHAPSVEAVSRRGATAAVVRAAERQALGYGAYLTAHSAGRICALKMPSDRDRQSGGGKRGRVVGFSQASRLRMMRLIHTVERSTKMPVFVTLTFPDLFPEFADAKRRLDTLFKRWKRRWPGTSCIWRMETVARKSGSNEGQIAPHFHLLVWGEFDGEKARSDWFEVCGSDEYAHFRHGTKADKLMEDWKQAAYYCAKYCAKETDAAVAGGRIWGIHNRAALPVDREPVVMRLTLPEAFGLRRLIRRAIKAKTGRVSRCAQSLYTSDPESLLRWVCARRGIIMRRSGT